MKILIGSSSPLNKGSGIRTYVYTISEELKKQGHDLFFTCPYNENMLEETKINQRSYLETSEKVSPEKAIKEICKFVKNNKIDFVINNDNPYLSMSAPCIKCPIVSVGHLSNTSIATLACYQNHWLDYVVSISEDMNKTFSNKFKVQLPKLRIIYNGVEPFEVDTDKKNSDTLNIIFAGGLNKRKGGDKILNSILNSNPKNWKGMHLHWFGDIDPKTQKKISNYNFVTIYGKTDRTFFMNKLLESHVLLLPSRSEGCPMVMLEAMSRGVIPVASDGKGAMSRLIVHGKEGFICSLRKWENQMFQCLHYLKDNPSARKAISEATYARQKSEFTIEQVVTSLVQLSLHPTVDRSSPPKHIELLKWHRPFTQPGAKLSIIDRVCIKAGILRKSGKINTMSILDYN